MQLHSETYIRKQTQLYSGTYIRQVIQLYSETNVQGLHSETYILKLTQMYSETNDPPCPRHKMPFSSFFRSHACEFYAQVLSTRQPLMSLALIDFSGASLVRIQIRLTCEIFSLRGLTRTGPEEVTKTAHVFAKGGGNFELFWWKKELVVQRGGKFV